MQFVACHYKSWQRKNPPCSLMISYSVTSCLGMLSVFNLFSMLTLCDSCIAWKTLLGCMCCKGNNREREWTQTVRRETSRVKIDLERKHPNEKIVNAKEQQRTKEGNHQEIFPNPSDRKVLVYAEAMHSFQALHCLQADPTGSNIRVSQ